MQLLDVLGGFLRTQALAVVARLGVADVVGCEPVAVQELAARVQADPSALYRVMRLLASVGIFSEASPGTIVGPKLREAARPRHADAGGGKERTEREWRTLLQPGGFELVRITDTPATSFLEAAPA
jgi:hypothetical protein